MSLKNDLLMRKDVKSKEIKRIIKQKSYKQTSLALGTHSDVILSVRYPVENYKSDLD